MTKRDEILAGAASLVGPWPGQDHEYRRDDWEVGYMNIMSGRHDKIIKVRNEERHKAYAYYLRASRR